MSAELDAELTEAERDAYLADGDREIANDVMGTLLASAAGRRGDPGALLLAARAHAALCSARRRSIADLEARLRGSG